MGRKLWIVFADRRPVSVFADKDEARSAANTALHRDDTGAIYSLWTATLDVDPSDPGIPVYRSRDATDDVLG